MLNMEAIHRRVIDRIRGWAKAHSKRAKIFLGIGIIVFVSIVVLVSLVLSAKPAFAPVATIEPEPKPEPVFYYSPLTGVEVKNEKITKAAVTAIMIENSPDARPQSGLKEAGVVFEAIAEGGITRFVALYQENKPKLIGPVRSVRLYFVDWLAPFNASVAHVGGSANALRVVRTGGFRDIDQFFNPGTYWRATDRWAPHNVYTNFKKLDALNKAKGFKTSKFTSWPRIESEPAEKRKATKINVHVSGPLFDSAYVYDKKTNKYNRSQGGAAHIDRESGRIAPSVVIILDTIENTVFEDGYRESIKTSGSGKVRIFQGGNVIKGKWSKEDRKSQIKFVDSKGEEIDLFSGQTWITAIPTNRGGNVTWQ